MTASNQAETAEQKDAKLIAQTTTALRLPQRTGKLFDSAVHDKADNLGQREAAARTAD
jgi:hypothetical protein